MRKTVYFGQSSFRFWYLRVKDTPYYSVSIISSVIFVCLLLIIQFVIPQVTSWFSVREEVIATRERIAILKENIQHMNNLDKGRLNSQLEIATFALPIQKDFGAVLDAVSIASIKSGVSVDDFSFQVGKIASGGAEKVEVDQKGLSTVNLTVNIIGSLERLTLFVQGLKETLPLSEITLIEGNGKSAAVTISFYQKQFPTMTVKPEVVIPPVADKNAALLDQLSGWRTANPVIINNDTVGSNAAIPLF